MERIQPSLTYFYKKKARRLKKNTKHNHIQQHIYLHIKGTLNYIAFEYMKKKKFINIFLCLFHKL